MDPNFHERQCVCKGCGAEFMRLFNGKKPPKLEKRRCFCPFCGDYALTADTRK